MKRKVTKVVVMILICVISLGAIFTYVNKDVIFQRGNPIPYIKKVIVLSKDEPYKKVFDDKEIYISKGREHYIKVQDSLIRFVESKYDVTFVEQAGSGYIFQSGNQTVIMGTEVYLKYYNIWEISAKQNAELSDLIPMVRIGGKLYLDTGKESDIDARCGVMDGKITSTVEPFQKPTRNNQSNFGSGYEYQFVNNDSIDIYMNEKWIRFENKN